MRLAQILQRGIGGIVTTFYRRVTQFPQPPSARNYRQLDHLNRRRRFRCTWLSCGLFTAGLLIIWEFFILSYSPLGALIHPLKYRALPCVQLYDPQLDFMEYLQSEGAQFMETWKRYVDYHKCVTAGVWPRGRVVSQIPSGTSTNIRERYVICNTVNGIGNRIVGSSSCVLYAMITGRVFQILWRPGDNHRAEYHDLFRSLDGLDITLLVSSPVFMARASLSRVTHLLRNRWHNSRLADAVKGKVSVPAGYADPGRSRFDSSLYFDETMLCGVDTSVLSRMIEERVMWLYSDQYYAAVIKRSLKSQLWLQNPHSDISDGQLFVRIARQIFEPIETIRKRADSLRAALPAFSPIQPADGESGVVSVGIQLRSFTQTPKDTQPFHDCFQGIRRRLQPLASAKRIQIYVTGDSDDRIAELTRSIYQMGYIDVINANDLTALVPDRDWHASIPDTAKRYAEAIVELLILSSCNFFITTSGSTFGSSVEVWRPLPSESPNQLIELKSRTWIVWPSEGLRLQMEATRLMSPETARAWPLIEEKCAASGTSEPRYPFEAYAATLENKQCYDETKTNAPGERLIS